jgi:outer membrane protein assembly factor BamB
LINSSSSLVRRAPVTGSTFSTDFPTVQPFQPDLRGGLDSYVTKFDPTGGVVYSTHLGGSGITIGQGIAVDAKGQAYVTGSVWGSPDFPTENPVQPVSAGANDVFITQFDPTGAALVFSTFLGGSSDDIGIGITVDSEGNIYVTGWTSSSDFPTVNPFQPDLRAVDAFVTKISPWIPHSRHGSTGEAFRKRVRLAAANGVFSRPLLADLPGSEITVRRLP